MMPIPLELVTMLGSGVLSGVMTIWSKKVEADRERTDALIKMRTQDQEGFDKARQVQNSGFAYTRRAIALMSVFAIIVWPKFVPVLWPEILTIVGWTAWDPGFLFFEGKDVTQFEYLKGLVITPLDTHLVSAIVGLYFGASMVKNAK